MAGSSARAQRPAIGGDPASYEHDPYSWSIRQASFLRESRFDELDIAHLAEEIESVGRSERNSLRAYLALVLQHMLTWDHQPEKRTPSWATSIRIHRLHAGRQLRDNPGLKGQLPQLLADAYDLAVIQATEETGLPDESFPRTCRYTLDEVMARPHEV